MTVRRITHYALRIAPLITIIIILLFAPLISGGLAKVALAQAPVTATVDRTSISTDEQVTLTVTVSGDFLNVPRPDLSDLTEFVVVSSRTSTQISIVNGRMTSQGVFTYRLQPLRAGALVIPPIKVSIDNQTYQTGPIKIDVVAGISPNAPSQTPVPTVEAPAALQNQPLFVEAEVDNSTPYLGQQIIYIFRFYQAADAPIHTLGRPDYKPPPFTNFWSRTVVSQPRYTALIAGREYLVTEIRTALFPANPGSLTIDPARLVIPGGLFNPDVVLETQPVALEVQPLPPGAPADFTGAVGQFEIRTELGTTEGRVNEPVTLVLTIEGAGNIEVLTEPALPELPNWRIFDSQSSTNIEAQGDVVYGTRRFERLIVPGQAGDYTFPPVSFSYYDPQAGEYRTISSDPIPITIQPNGAESAAVTITGPNKQSIELIASDIRHIKPVPPSLVSEETNLVGNPIYWSFWVFPVLVVGGVWVWQSRRHRLLEDVGYARSQRARRVAHRILADAGRSGIDGYAAAHRALLGYLSDKLNRPIAGLTTDNLIDLLKQNRLDPALLRRLEAMLDQMETGRFAPVGPVATQSLISETRQLINDLEKSFGGRR